MGFKFTPTSWYVNCGFHFTCLLIISEATLCFLMSVILAIIAALWYSRQTRLGLLLLWACCLMIKFTFHLMTILVRACTVLGMGSFGFYKHYSAHGRVFCNQLTGLIYVAPCRLYSWVSGKWISRVALCMLGNWNHCLSLKQQLGVIIHCLAFEIMAESENSCAVPAEKNWKKLPVFVFFKDARYSFNMVLHWKLCFKFGSICMLFGCLRCFYSIFYFSGIRCLSWESISRQYIHS